jgi:hypothetical protein
MILLFSLWTALLYALPAHAGNQKEEAMADSVRLALSKAISDPRPPKPSFNTIEERISYLHWLGEMSSRLKKRIPDYQTRIELLKRYGMNPNAQGWIRRW